MLPTPIRLFLLSGLLLIPMLGVPADQAPVTAEVSNPDASPAMAKASVPGASTKALDLGDLRDLEHIVPKLAGKRVVFIGENHDRYDHHLNQLAIIRQLHARNPNLVIAMEFFQQPFQSYLDAYIGGSLDERTFLEKTEYFERWGYDYRLYRPIIEYAREQAIPLLALNIPREISTKVGQSGIDSLTEEERRWVPEQMDRSDESYRKRLKAIFERHPDTKSRKFEYFYEAQLLWDEGMAERAARYLTENPGRQMVVLAGEGHLAYGAGIPERLVRRVPVDTAIVLQGTTGEEMQPGIADFLLFSSRADLPPSGRLGVALRPPGRGVRVESVVPGSAAGRAGIRADDRILAINGQEVERLADLKLALMDTRPGETVQVRVERQPIWLMDPEELVFDVTLQ